MYVPVLIHCPPPPTTKKRNDNNNNNNNNADDDDNDDDDDDDDDDYARGMSSRHAVTKGAKAAAVSLGLPTVARKTKDVTLSLSWNNKPGTGIRTRTGTSPMRVTTR